MFSIGPYQIAGRALLAPMAGVSDSPFRHSCLQLGASMAVSEMLTADTRLWHSPKSRSRLVNKSQGSPFSVQIAGSDPHQMAQAAQTAVDQGAQIIDINMGCPAKKVCNRAAGSALLKDEPLVAAILKSVVTAVAVPVTLKIRTGWCPASKNATRIARLAEDIGVQALTIHGRTRACRFNGKAEYTTIAEVVDQVAIPVIANGDIVSPAGAHQVLQESGAAAVMIGRGAQGNPWIFASIHHFLATGELLPRPALADVASVIQQHLQEIYQLYGTEMGVRIARKHFSWYCSAHLAAPGRHHRFNQLATPEEQLQETQDIFGHHEPLEEQAA